MDENDLVRRTVAGLVTKSDKIRALHKAGLGPADIARHRELGITYQHAYNVLKQEGLVPRRARGRYAMAPAAPVQAEDGGESFLPRETGDAGWLQVGADGRMFVPPHLRRLLGVESGGPVFATIQDGALRLVGRENAIRDLQDTVRRLTGEGSLVDELIAERRREVARENGE